MLCQSAQNYVSLIEIPSFEIRKFSHFYSYLTDKFTMKFVVLLFSFTLVSYAKECSEVGIDLNAQVKFSEIKDGKRIKASKDFKVPSSWNSNSNIFHEVRIETDKDIDLLDIRTQECLGCNKEFNREVKVKLVREENLYVSKDFKLNSILNEKFVYPGAVTIILRNNQDIICEKIIKLERIK
jgi:hypothetical protein